MGSVFWTPLFSLCRHGGKTNRLGSPRFQRQPFASFEEAAARIPSPRPACSPLISGPQRCCVRGCSRSARLTRRRPCDMLAPKRGVAGALSLSRHVGTAPKRKAPFPGKRLGLHAKLSHPFSTAAPVGLHPPQQRRLLLNGALYDMCKGARRGFSAREEQHTRVHRATPRWGCP